MYDHRVHDDDDDPGFSPDLLVFGERLRALRSRCGLTQTEVADIIGLRVTTVGDWELAKSEPKFSQAVALSRLYDVSLDVLAGLTPMPPPTKRRPTSRRPS